MFEEVQTLLLDTILKDNTNNRNRKIIFWYDEKEEYREFINEVNISDTEIIVYDNNSFWIRYHIEKEELEKNIILYFPFARIKGIENPLLDLETMNKDYIFNPDSTTMRLRNLDLDDDCRGQVKKYARFFNNKKREESFRLFDMDKTPDNIDYVVTSILLNIKSISEDDILKNLFVSYYEDNKKFEETIKFGDESFIYGLFNRTFGTNIASESDIEDTFKSLLFTYFATNINDPDKVGRYSKYILKEKTTNVYVFINSLMRDKYSKNVFESLSLNIEKEFGISELLKGLNIEDYLYNDTFKVIDNKIILYLIDKLVHDAPEYDRYIEIIEERENKYYYEEYKNSYKMIKNTIEFLKTLNTIKIKVDDIEKFVSNYTDNLYLVDTYYRKIYYYFDLISDKDDFIELKEKIENIYVNDFVSELSIKWSDMLDNLSSYNANRLTMQNKFFDTYVKPFEDRKDRVIVIISDSFRYELAKELNAKLKSFSVKSEVDTMLGVIPSYTKLGMASLLPNKTISKVADSDDILVDGMSTSSIKDRELVLQKELADSMVIKYDDLYEMTKTNWKKMFTGKKIVYIYHDTVDNAGEHNDNKIFEACSTAINELEKLIRDLHLTFGGVNAFITSDHGFFYKRGKVESHEKISKDKGATKQKTRYSYSNIKNNDEGIISLKLNYLMEDSEEYVNVPKGNTIYARQGSGFNYIHGGATPQEIIVPVIDFKSTRTMETIKKVSITYSGLSTKITNAITYLEFLQDTNVDETNKPCRYLLHFEDETGNRISDECTIIANYENTEVKNRFFKEKFVFKNISYDRTKDYYLVVIDEETGIEANRIKFMIDITIINNFGF